MDSIFSGMYFLFFLGVALIIPLANVKSHIARQLILWSSLLSFNLGAVYILLVVWAASRLAQPGLGVQALPVSDGRSPGQAVVTVLVFAAIFAGQNVLILIINRRTKMRINSMNSGIGP